MVSPNEVSTTIPFEYVMFQQELTTIVLRQQFLIFQFPCSRGKKQSIYLKNVKTKVTVRGKHTSANVTPPPSNITFPPFRGRLKNQNFGGCSIRGFTGSYISIKTINKTFMMLYHQPARLLSIIHPSPIVYDAVIHIYQPLLSFLKRFS